MNINVVVELILGACALVCFLFVGVYWAFAPWHRSGVGRQIMSMSLLLGVLFTYRLLVRLGVTEGYRGYIDAIMYTAVLGVLLWQLCLLILIQVRRDKVRRGRNESA